MNWNNWISGNVRLPAGLERALRWPVVTQDVPRVHHSVQANEASGNSGGSPPSRDRLVGKISGCAIERRDGSSSDEK